MPAILRFMGWDDARLYPSDWSLTTNPFWSTFLFSLILFPCLFYTTWYFNPSLSRNRLGLSWVLGFYSALLFTIAGFYEVPHLRTVFNAAVDYQPSVSSVLSLGYGEIATTGTGAGTDVSLGLTAAAGAVAAARQICYPILTAGALALLPTLPSFMKLDLSSTTPDKIFQGQMKRPHLLFSLENYPDDGRIGPHIIAANFQAFLVCDLILGAIHYRRQLEPFSTVVHHIIYFFIVVHMRAGDMLSVFCILGTPIEAYGRMFPHLRTPTIERLYLTCFITTRLGYVSLLWHEVYYNYPDKSVAFLYTITLSLHVYWFVLYIQTQRRFAEKQRRQQLCTVLTTMANALKEEFVASAAESAGISSTDVFGVPGKLMDKEAHVKDGEQDPLLDQSTAKKRKEGEDMLLPQPDSNVSHRVRRRSEPQV
ncbi:hypothetical protein BGZ90_005501 [Linnemannia elongata]|nr:hypothetical protein BGZ90_005501 [Linnemannia elongata]